MKNIWHLFYLSSRGWGDVGSKTGAEDASFWQSSRYGNMQMLKIIYCVYFNIPVDRCYKTNHSQKNILHQLQMVIFSKKKILFKGCPYASNKRQRTIFRKVFVIMQKHTHIYFLLWGVKKNKKKENRSGVGKNLTLPCLAQKEIHLKFLCTLFFYGLLIFLWGC